MVINRWTKILLLICFLLISLKIHATHTFGGYISYEHVSGLNYEITVTIYADRNQPAIGRREIEIDWGDNLGTDTLILTNEEIVSNSSDLLKRTWTKQHTYPGPGNYKISIADPNRVSGINNMANSLNQPLYLETLLRIFPFSNENNSSILLNTSLFLEVKNDKPAKINLAAYDSDGDYLFFELVDTKGLDGFVARGYKKPDSSSINTMNGELMWDNPELGYHIFTIKVSECRNDVDIAYTLVDLLVNVTTTNSTKNQFNYLTAVQRDKNGNIEFIIKPSDTLNIEVEYESDIGQVVDLKLVNDTNFYNHFLKVTYTALQSNKSSCKLTLLPDSSELSCTPYLFSLRGISDNTIEDLSIKVFVQDTSKLNCDTICGYYNIGIAERKKIFISTSFFPNPLTETSQLKFESIINLNNYKLIIYDITGRITPFNHSTNNNQIKITKGNQKNGIYFYQIETANNKISKGKFIIQ